MQIPKQRMQIYSNYEAYGAWVRNHDSLDAAARHAIREGIQQLPQLPLFSILLLLDQGDTACTRNRCIDSLRHQLYPFWELLWWGDSVRRDFRTALAEVSGDFVVPLPSDAKLAEHALYELATVIGRDPEAVLLYGDQDCIGPSGERHTPWFKTGWDPDLALGRDAIGLPVAYRTTLLEAVGSMRIRDHNDTLWLYDLSLCAGFAASPAHIHHIPTILCHRLASTDPSRSWNAEGAREIVRTHLAKSGTRGEVIPAPLAPAWNWIVRELPDPPLVSIIVPTRDHADLLERCTNSLFRETDYPAIEILVADNDSHEPAATALLQHLSQCLNLKIVNCPGPFNYSAMNNRAAREARGEVLVLLNNDTASIRTDWLREMVTHALRPDVGAVGARLLYANGQVQHGGMVFQPGVGPVHQFRFAERYDPGPAGELALARSVSIVTGACLALRRSLYFEVGAMDEGLRVAFSDVDLCMRLADRGYRIVWTPAAELFHFEGASRGYDTTPEKQALATHELNYFRRRWGSLLDADPFRNDNMIFGWDTVSLGTTAHWRRSRRVYPEVAS